MSSMMSCESSGSCNGTRCPVPAERIDANFDLPRFILMRLRTWAMLRSAGLIRDIRFIRTSAGREESLISIDAIVNAFAFLYGQPARGWSFEVDV